MKIAPIDALFFNKTPNQSFRGVASVCCPHLDIARDAFIKGGGCNNERHNSSKSSLHNGSEEHLRICRKITPSNYVSMPEWKRDSVMSNISSDIVDMANENIQIAFSFEDQLDKKYGKNGYKFVSIGTSPACVAKVMEYMGHDVVYLPMSFSKQTVAKPWLDSSPYINFYRRYMDEKGLSQEKLDSEGKKAIVCDYISTGRSLKFAKYMLTGVLGLKKDSVDTITMNSVIENSFTIPQKMKSQYLNDLLKNEKIGDYCDVPHFSFLDKGPLIDGSIACYEDLKYRFDNYISPYSSSYNFAVMHTLNKNGLLAAALQ